MLLKEHKDQIRVKIMVGNYDTVRPRGTQSMCPKKNCVSQNCLSSNSQFEELKRNHFLKFTNNAYETVRRLLYSSQFQENSDYKQTYGRQRFLYEVDFAQSLVPCCK